MIMSPARAHPTAIGTIELELAAADLFAQKSISIIKIKKGNNALVIGNSYKKKHYGCELCSSWSNTEKLYGCER